MERKKFNKINLSFFRDNKLLWKPVKLFFSNKENFGTNKKIVEEDELMEDNQEE